MAEGGALDDATPRPAAARWLQASGTLMGLHPKKQARRLLQVLSEARRKYRNLRHIARDRDVPRPPPVAPVWPLPRRPGGPSDEEIRAAFARHDAWHYAF